MGAMCKIIDGEMNYLSVVLSCGLGPALHIIILRYDRHRSLFPPVTVDRLVSVQVQHKFWMRRWTPASYNLNTLLSTRSVAKHRQHFSITNQTSSLCCDDLLSTALLTCNAVGCLTQRPGGFCSRSFFRDDQSLMSAATTVNLFVACLLNYSYQMCILVLTDHSGNSVMLKLSLGCRGAIHF